MSVHLSGFSSFDLSIGIEHELELLRSRTETRIVLAHGCISFLLFSFLFSFIVLSLVFCIFHRKDFVLKNTYKEV